MRWAVLDEIIKIEKGKSVLARSHVPQEDISPEVLFIEMMAQSGGLLLGAEKDFKEDVVFAKIDFSIFPMPGQEGETLEIRVEAETLRPEGAWVLGKVSCPRGILAEARLMLACAGTLVPGKNDSTTFHEFFMKHFEIREKVQ